MGGVSYYRDPCVPCFELKFCDTEDLAYKTHNHEELALGIVDEGSSRFCYEGNEVMVNPGSFVVIPPGVFHSCNPSDRRLWRYRMLFVQPAWIKRASDTGLVFSAYAGEHPVLSQAMVQLADCLMSGASPLEKEAHLVEFLTEIISGQQEFHLHPNSVTDWKRLRKVRDYLYAHFLERVTLDELESISGLSKSYLLRLFRQEYQVSPHVYQTVLRINFAKQLLLKKRPIAEVSLESGFFDQSHFTKMFKMHVGVTPENYIKH